MNLMPVARRGITATPFQIDYEGKPAFLIDASVFSGSSGSPVFIMNIGSYSDRSGSFHPNASRLFFLGVLAQAFQIEEEGRIDFRPVPTTKTPIVNTDQMIDIGIVYKSSTVKEIIDDYLNGSD